MSNLKQSVKNKSRESLLKLSSILSSNINLKSILGSDYEDNSESNLESEQDSEIESDSEPISDTDSDNELDTILDLEPKNVLENKIKKEKKEKLTFEQIISDMKDCRLNITQNNEKIYKLEKEIKLFQDTNKYNEKQITKLLNFIDKAHEESINKAKKEKKKRTNSGRNGILKPLPVPPILAKFLKINENDLLERTKIMSLLSTEFKNRGLKNGHVTILDKQTASELGVSEGYMIEFKNFHTFISSYYKLTTVNLNKN